MITRIPAFTMTGDDGKVYTEQNFLGKITVLYFYPKDNTSACTIEAIDFTALSEEFTRLNCNLAGISKDSGKTHCNFKAKHNLNLLLLTDPDWQLANSLNLVIDKKMYGKPVRGLVRSTFLFAADGQLIKTWTNVKVPNHAQEVLDFIKSLPSS